MKKSLSIYAIISVFMASVATSAFSQDAAPVAPAAPQVKEMAIYGEVQAVNAVANTLSVQYYDYDSDSEKTTEVVVSADTKLENAKTVSDVKKGDWVDVTYSVSDGKNMAKTVSVEKEEPVTEPAAGAPAASDTSSDE